MMLTVCIITKDEEKKIKRCIKQLVSYPFEIVVVDTGSVDGTLDLLNHMQGKYPQIQIYHFPWRDDFAAAKNFAVTKASNDMVMVLDSDEYVEEIRIQELRDFLKKRGEDAGRILRKNQVEQNGQLLCSIDYTNRIFSKHHYRYQGKIHEQLVRIDGKEYETYKAPVTVLHDGYLGTPEERQAKAYRNIRLLKRELEEQGEDPYVYYQLGKGCYMAGEYAEASEYFKKGLSFDLNPDLEYVIDMVETYGYALLHSGNARTALQFEHIYDTFANTSDFHILMGFIYMNNELFDKAVEEFVRAPEAKEARMEGADSYLAWYNAGVVEECRGQIEKAKEFYGRCGGYLPASERMKALLKRS